MDVLNKYRKTERIGRLSDRVAIQSFTESTNAYGERVESWSTAATVWAEIVYSLRSKEGEQAGQEQAQQVVKITIRTRTINETYRVVYDGRTYDIEAMEESNDRQYITLTCTQIDQ